MTNRSSQLRVAATISFILSAMYFIGIADLEYGYYTFLRIFTLIALIVFLYLYSMAKERFLTPVNGIVLTVLILFNPLMPVYLDKDTWIVLDAICGAVMTIVSIYVLVEAYIKRED